MIRITVFVALIALAVTLLVNRAEGRATTVSAQCVDGTLSKSTSRAGTCSRHGGVKQWIGQKP